MIYATAALTCVDNPERFEIERPNVGDTAMKSCYHARKNPRGQCAKPEIKANCPVACNACPPILCEDSEDNFEVNRPNVGGTAMKSCRHARKNPLGQCAKPEMKANCPVTCKSCPNNVTCNLVADLKFPADYSEGVHKDSVQVEKDKEEEVCYSENQKTSWGCTHLGDAFFNATAGVILAESAHVFNAGGGKYTLRVSHDYLEADVLQSTTATTNSRASLIVKVNGKPLGTFKHWGKKKETHEGFTIVGEDSGEVNVGFINPEFNGDYAVQVNCNDDCECDVERVDQRCKLQAQLRFPGLTEKAENEYYHADVLTITNEENEECSVFNNVTSWCRAYGDAVLFRTEPGYYDYDEAFAAVIPDAAGKTFNLALDHYPGQEEYYDGYYPTPAVLEVFANGMPLFDGATHRLVGDPCGVEYNVKVDCDDSCNCEIIVPSGCAK